MPGEHLDLSSDLPERSGNKSSGSGSRPYVGLRFACCRVYSRAYLNREQTAYVGYCPRCSQRVQLRVGPDGSDARFFEVY